MKPTDRGSAAVSAETGRDQGRSIQGCMTSATKPQMCNGADFYTEHFGFKGWNT